VPSGALQTGRVAELTADDLTKLMAEVFPGDIPWTITDADDDGVELTLKTDEDNTRPGGSISGPTMMMLADSAAYVALLTQIGAEPLAVTTNLNINFLRRPFPGTLTARGSLLKLGRTLGISEVELFSEGVEKPVAHATVTYSLALLEER
jgi:uncharacterized protein (TIGR00369 family)